MFILFYKATECVFQKNSELEAECKNLMKKQMEETGGPSDLVSRGASGASTCKPQCSEHCCNSPILPNLHMQESYHFKIFFFKVPGLFSFEPNVNKAYSKVFF